MDTSSEKDASSEVANELETMPKIEVMSEIVKVTSKNASETILTSEKNSVDDTSKADTASETHVMFNADVISNKIDVVSTDKSSNIAVPPRGLRRKPYADQRERRHSITILDRSVSKHKFERDFEAESNTVVSSASTSHGNFCGNTRHEENSRESSSVASEKSKIQQTFEVEESPKEKRFEGLFVKTFAVGESPKEKRVEGLFVKTTSEITEEGSSTIEIEKSKLDGASATIGVRKTRVVEGPSAESLSGVKKRKAKGTEGKGSLRSTLKRKMDLIEGILEDQVEQIWEENVKKHTWLQPIDTWIVDHYRPSSNYALTHCQPVDTSDNSTDVNQDVMPEPTYDFKFTPATGENKEPKIESRLMENRRTARVDEPRIESRMIDNWRRLQNRIACPKSDRFEPASLITQLNKQEKIVSPHMENGEKSPNISNDPGILEVKEIKRHDLLDKLKDNVKEKMEDIHRVELQEDIF